MDNPPACWPDNPPPWIWTFGGPWVPSRSKPTTFTVKAKFSLSLGSGCGMRGCNGYTTTIQGSFTFIPIPTPPPDECLPIPQIGSPTSSSGQGGNGGCSGGSCSSSDLIVPLSKGVDANSEDNFLQGPLIYSPPPDLTFGSRGLLIQFKRSYSSSSSEEGPFGVGWSFNYDKKILSPALPSNSPDSSSQNVIWGDNCS
ncbi:MAG: DUF6531 domain-containing protein, partial [bacterium]